MNHKEVRHFNLPHHVHELTFSCYRNQNFFKNDKFCRLLLDCLNKARARHSFKLIAYVILPDHVHLLIHPIRDEYRISKILSGIKVAHSRKVVNLLRSTDSRTLRNMSRASTTGLPTYRFWQRGGGYDRNLVSRQAVLNSIEYIHNNPVRKGLVNSPENWIWSSAGYYAGRADIPIEIDDEILELLP